MKSPFYLVFPVTDIESTRIFYTGIIGCSVGREAKCWIDFNFFGYKISAHLAETLEGIPVNPVDGESVCAASWFGSGRFEGEIGEQATFFISDPGGNVPEFKSFRDSEQLFIAS